MPILKSQNRQTHCVLPLKSVSYLMNMGCERQVPYAVMNYREVEVVIVEVGGDRGYNWHTLQA